VTASKVTELSDGWILQPPAPAFSGDDVHVWEFPLTVSDPQFNCQRLLSADEQARASRFHFEQHARKFMVARALMRSILAQYEHILPEALRFEYSKQGKPALAGNARGIRFNLSHSGEMGLLAVALGREIGADIEAMRDNVETDKLAERFFSPHERESLRALSPQLRIAAFYRCWTCKEAFLKAQGVGLFRGLSTFDVEVNPGLPARLVATRPDASESQHWQLHDVETATHYAAAVAVEGNIGTLKLLRSRTV
jgi:4'-phosphopantetheinyl transferase